MKKLLLIGLLAACATLTAFTAHKFYVSIYQVQYVPEKKMLQITARIFVDDLNQALQVRYKRKSFLGEKTESDEDRAHMTEYLLQNLSIKINAQPQTIHFLSREFENNVVICYFNVKDATKVKTLGIRNTALFDLFPDQQHIIQADVSGSKQNLLLTADHPEDVLRWE